MIWGKLISFTKNGAKTAEKIAYLLENDCKIEIYNRGTDLSLKGTSLRRMVQQAMADCNLIIFIGSTGIAVRSIAPYLQGKQYDPAVIVVDELGKFVISLISGHIGGANTICEKLSNILGATPVITTATDLNSKFAVDTWAVKNRCVISDVSNIKHISSAVLNDERVGIYSDFNIKSNLPENIVQSNDCTNGFTVMLNTEKSPFLNTLHLIPQIIHIGIGCRKGTPKEKIDKAVKTVLDKHKIDIRSVADISSIDLKKNEAGILAFCRENNIKFNTFSADMLNNAEGEFSKSEFVKSIVGTDNVCERCAVLSSKNTELICKKTSLDGVTVAVSAEKWEVKF